MLTGTVNKDNAVQIVDLAYWYDPDRIILNTINLTIADNEFIAILGQNGSGKTTLLKNISGLLRPCRGSIHIRGMDTSEMGVAHIAGKIGFVMQDSDRQLFEQTVYDETAFALKHIMPRNDIPRKVEESLNAVGLWDKRDAFPLALNRADRVKVVFASVLAMGPAIIMLDEPAAGQDNRGCRMIMDMITNLHAQGYTIILVTHNIAIAAQYARRIIALKDGSVYMDGSAADIFGQEEKLSGTGIIPPQITRLSGRLRKHVPLDEDALSCGDLAAKLVQLKQSV